MRYYRIAAGAGATWALAEGDRLRLLAGPPWASPAPLAESIPLSEAALLPPATPSKIVAIGLNYADHAAERGAPPPAEPMIFLKPSTAVIGPGEAIRIPSWAGRVDHEAELGLVIGRAAHGLADPQVARAHIFGALCVNDVTARELQSRDVQFTRAKGFDSFCPVGPSVATGLDLSRLEVVCRVNGSVRQRGTTDRLIFSPEHLVWFVSRVMTLLPGDIISTGTPSGIGPLAPGDVVEVEVTGVGVLRNPVVAG